MDLLKLLGLSKDGTRQRPRLALERLEPRVLLGGGSPIIERVSVADDGIPLATRNMSESAGDVPLEEPLIQYEVYGSSEFDPMGGWDWWDLEWNPQNYGFEFLGTGYETETFEGAFDYYLVIGADRAAASAVIDAIVGSDGRPLAVYDAYLVAYPELTDQLDGEFAVLGVGGERGGFLLGATGRDLSSMTAVRV